LCRKVGCSKRTIERAEAGEPIRLRTANAIAEALSADLCDLVSEEARKLLKSARDFTSVSVPTAIPRYCPQELPPQLRDFVGREREIERMSKRLRTSTGGIIELSAVNGMGGVGKSSLAIEVGHRLKDRFPSGQVFLELLGMQPEPMSVPRALTQLLISLCPERRVPGEESLLPEYRSAMAAAGQVLVILDDAANAGQVRTLIPGPPAGVIVTSRHALSLSEFGNDAIELDRLAASEAFALFRGIVDRGSDEEARVIVDLCHCLPMAIRVAGDFLRQRFDWPVDEYIESLRWEGLSRLKHGDRDIEIVLKHSATQLLKESFERATRWSLLALLETEFDKETAAAVWQVAPDDPSVRDDLSNLVARSMLKYDPKSGTYRMHDLMRPIAANLFQNRNDEHR